MRALPNLLTLSRIALAAVFMTLVFRAGLPSKVGALLVFGLASLTDYWDGRLARRSGSVSAFGRLMDPIADKILTLSAFLAFVQMALIPAWMALAIIARDLLITGLRLLAAPEAEMLSPGRAGKHKTVLQLAAILGVLGYLCAREMPWWQAEWSPAAHRFIAWSIGFVVAVTLWSGIRYVRRHLATLEVRR